jgi:ketosteroid isomerase-like protein
MLNQVEGTMMKSSNAIATTCLPLVLALSLSACTSQRDMQLPADVTTALEAAFNKGDIQACADIYTDDAEIIAEDAPVVRGKEAISRFFNGEVSRDISFDTETTVSVVSGDVAVEQGTYRVRNVVRGLDVEHGDYLNVWRRSPNGQWKAYRSMYNVTVSPGSVVSVLPEFDERTM